MFRSLHGRLVVLLVLLLAAAIAAGTLMVGLFRQSASAQIGQADAQIARACDAIAGAYRFYSVGWPGPATELEDPSVRRSLIPVVQKALRTVPGVEGGIWQGTAGPLAYAFPTYEGSGPKTDLPQAELPRISAVNRDALAEDHTVSRQYQARSQTLLITACPLAGPIPQLTAWTMTRVTTFAGSAYRQLMAGLAVLLAAVLGAAVLLTRLTMTWSRHVARIEATLAAHELEDLPKLPSTGEHELDRIIHALNDAGSRLSLAHQRAAELSQQVATGERLAAIGRVVAGVAHEIRNPIAAMRLKTENALAAGGARTQAVLPVILGQIERLDRLLRRLLSVTERDQPHQETVVLNPFLDVCLATHVELAQERGLTLERVVEIESARFDPEQIRHALDNLVLNAIQAAPAGSRVRIAAFLQDDCCVLSVQDEGAGPPAGIREHLFEPFVTGRPEGTGLGLSIVREVAEAHRGTVRFVTHDVGTTFEILLPWPTF
jgi:signal transduction histidine kinase